MDGDGDVTVHLSVSDVYLLFESLDAYEYWELGDVLPRNNGAVFIPGDIEPAYDRYWGSEPELSAEQGEAIEAIHDCRGLASRLRLAIDDTVRP